MGYYLPKRKGISSVASPQKRLLKKLFFFLLLLFPLQHLLAQTSVVKGRVSTGDTALANVTVQVKGKTPAPLPTVWVSLQFRLLRMQL